MICVLFGGWLWICWLGFVLLVCLLGLGVLLAAEVVGWFTVVDRCLDLAVLVV